MLSIITVNYKNLDALEKLWESLQRSKFQDFEWIIVDNNAPGNESKILEEFFSEEPNVFVIALKKNLGFGEACNEGTLFAKGDFLAFVNPDIIITQTCLGKLFMAVEDTSHGGGIIVPQLVNTYQSAQENCRKFPSIWELFGRRLRRQTTEFKANADGTMVAVDWAQGSFLVMRKTLFNDLGGFDPRFFLFMEDTDLCRRCWESGWRVFLVPTVTAIHGTKRLSGGLIFTAIFKKTFWIHFSSVIKYFMKYKGKKSPKVF